MKKSTHYFERYGVGMKELEKLIDRVVALGYYPQFNVRPKKSGKVIMLERTCELACSVWILPAGTIRPKGAGDTMLEALQAAITKGKLDA